MAINYLAALPPEILLQASSGCINLSSFSTLDSLIRSMFSSGEQGVAYDPNDLSTMWQDQAKLLPVTGEGQPVWHILDKSGNNNHAFATSSATRPILRKNATTGAYYLEFDGSDDFLVTSNIDFTATDKVSLFAGVRNLSGVAGMICELSNTIASNAGSFTLVSGKDAGGTGYNSSSRGSAAAAGSLAAKAFTYTPPESAVLSASHSISGSLSRICRNGVYGVDGVGNKGTGNFGNYPLYIGRRGGTSIPFNGHIYSLIGVGRIATDTEISAIEKVLAKQLGVTLP